MQFRDYAVEEVAVTCYKGRDRESGESSEVPYSETFLGQEYRSGSRYLVLVQ